MATREERRVRNRAIADKVIEKSRAKKAAKASQLGKGRARTIASPEPPRQQGTRLRPGARFAGRGATAPGSAAPAPIGGRTQRAVDTARQGASRVVDAGRRLVSGRGASAPPSGPGPLNARAGRLTPRPNVSGRGIAGGLLAADLGLRVGRAVSEGGVEAAFGGTQGSQFLADVFGENEARSRRLTDPTGLTRTKVSVGSDIVDTPGVDAGTEAVRRQLTSGALDSDPERKARLTRFVEARDQLNAEEQGGVGDAVTRGLQSAADAALGGGIVDSSRNAFNLLRGQRVQAGQRSSAPVFSEPKPAEPEAPDPSSLEGRIESQGLPESGRIGRTSRTVGGVPQFNQGFNPLDFERGTGFIRNESGQVTPLNFSPPARSTPRTQQPQQVQPQRINRQTADGARPVRLGAISPYNFAAPGILAGTNRLARQQELEERNDADLAAGRALTRGQTRAVARTQEAARLGIDASKLKSAKRKQQFEEASPLLEALRDANPETPQVAAQARQELFARLTDPNETNTFLIEQGDAEIQRQLNEANISRFGAGFGQTFAGRGGTASDFEPGDYGSMSLEKGGNLEQNGRVIINMSDLSPQQQLFLRRRIRDEGGRVESDRRG